MVFGPPLLGGRVTIGPALYNGFAGMPSLHAAYAAWTLAPLWPVARARSARSLLVIHLVAIVAVVIVTVNHYWLDVIAGAAVALVGAVIARRRPCQTETSMPAAAGLLVAAAVLIWLPRAATLPLTLDAAGAATLALLYLAVRRVAVG